MMLAIGLIVAAVITAYVGWKLVHGHHPQFMLLAAGLVFLLISWALGNPMEVSESTGWRGFDLFNIIVRSMKSKLSGIGTMIMIIAGFVAYMDYMGATKAMVHAAMMMLNKSNPRQPVDSETSSGLPSAQEMSKNTKPAANNMNCG